MAGRLGIPTAQQAIRVNLAGAPDAATSQGVASVSIVAHLLSGVKGSITELPSPFESDMKPS